MKNEQEYIILQIQEDDYGCEERPAGAKRTVFVRPKDAKENERMIRQKMTGFMSRGLMKVIW